MIVCLTYTYAHSVGLFKICIAKVEGGEKIDTLELTLRIDRNTCIEIQKNVALMFN